MSRLNQRKLWAVVVLMSIALLGLVCIQVYWVRQARELRETQFNLAVQSALQQVVHQLEVSEARLAFSCSLEEQKQAGSACADIDVQLAKARADSALITREDGALFAMLKGVPPAQFLKRFSPPEDFNRPQYPTVQPVNQSFGFSTLVQLPLDSTGQIDTEALRRNASQNPEQTLNPDSLMAAAMRTGGPVGMNSRVYTDANGELTVSFDLVRPVEAAPQPTPEEASFARARRKQFEEMPKRFAAEFAHYQQIQNQLQRLNTRKQDMALAAHQVLDKPRPVETRLDTVELRHELESAFKSQGINLPYACVIVGKSGHSFVPLAAAYHPDEPSANFYRAMLYPNDRLPQQNYLLITFPTKNEYLFKQMGLSFVSSILFVVLIVFGFTYTVRTIMRQKKISEMKTDFINNMTHEFKTPIATIALASEAIQDPSMGEKPTQRNRFVQIIREENKRLEGQVERVLQMAEIDRGQLELSQTVLDAHEILQNAVQKIVLQVERREGKIDLQLKATETMLYADALHLCNVFYNLLDNANKYSPEAPDISIQTRSDARWFCVSVTDRGIGMSAEAQKRIFESFYRVPTGNLHDVKGFGLGLSYVRSIVQGHKGRIEVRSEPGKGTCFEVYFPLNSITAK